MLATPTPSVEEAQRELLKVAARSMGVATERDLRDYFRLPTAEAKERIAELVEEGALVPVRSRAGATRRSSTPRPASPAASTPARCSGRSIR